ncbi:MAG: crossover junction endodeoxyribonuclease RuvC, partial [Planctomycetia bacterium]|nr:crossover junction endodeoxyribonuclease RuvC [Planctomycetia bacterium]
MCDRNGGGRRARLLEAGIIRATRAAHTEEGELPSRLLEIFHSVVEIIEQYRPESIALEALYSHYERPMTSVIMGHARGVICLAGAWTGVPVISYAATQVKRILTGSGRATKEQVQRAVQFELNLTTIPDP